MHEPSRFRDMITRDRTHSFEHEVERYARFNSGSRARAPKGKIVKQYVTAPSQQGETNGQ